MKKKLLVCVLSVSLGSALFAAGYPVFDFTASMNAINQFYQMYDQINATIENVQNGYEQLQQAYNQAKGIFSGELQLTEFGNDWWKNIGIARNRMKQTNAYVSSKVDAATAVKNKVANISWMNVDGVNFTTEDLMGFGKGTVKMPVEYSDGSKGSMNVKKDWKTALTANILFTKDKASKVQKGFQGMSAQEREKAMREGGFSANTAHIAVQSSAVTQSLMDEIEEANAAHRDPTLLNTDANYMKMYRDVVTAAQESEGEGARDDALLELELAKADRDLEAQQSRDLLNSMFGKKIVKEEVERQQNIKERAHERFETQKRENHEKYGDTYVSVGF